MGIQAKPQNVRSISGMPLVLFAASFVFYLWLSWQRVPGILGDQGWFLQVARRVATGELLYRDVLWSYGPLPVYIMSWLMQRGNYDIFYFSLLHIVTATMVTLVLYELHRVRLKTSHAAIGVMLVLVTGGTAGPFLHSYTPGIPIGALSMLLTLLGLLGCLKARNHFLSTWWVALGLGGALLSKLEFGFGALALCIFASVIVLRTRLASTEDGAHIRRVLTGGVAGILLAAIIYGALALQSGWQPLFDGITGYQVLQVAGGVSIGYWGAWSRTWLVSVYAPALAIVLLAGAYLYRNKLAEFPKRIIWILSIALLFGYLVYVLVWRTGGLLYFQRGSMATLDMTILADRLKMGWAELVWFAPLQFQKTLLIGIWIIILILTPRWIERLKNRRVVSFEQLACLITLAYAVLIELRYMVFAASFLLPTALVFLAAVLPAEFPQLKTLVRKVDRIIVLVCVVFAMLGINTLYSMWRHFANFDTPYVSSHGIFLADSETQIAVVESVQYVRENTHPTDCIAVLGPFPGIYYLSERRNCFRQDYLSSVVGNSASDVTDYLARIERYTPPILLVPQGDHNAGILQLRGTPNDGMYVRATNRRLFGSAAPQIEEYLLEHYQLDCFLNTNGQIEFAAFNRVK